jgi:hypothetical protein
MQRPNCSVCGLPGDEAGGHCPHCGNKPVIGPKTQRSRSQDPETDGGDFTKYLAMGVFIGAVLAASLVLFLVFSSGGTQQKGGSQVTPAQDTLIQTPGQTVPTTSAGPQEDSANDRRAASNPVRRGAKKTSTNAGDDGKRKRQDIIETPGKNPKMTQY